MQDTQKDDNLWCWKNTSKFTFVNVCLLLGLLIASQIILINTPLFQLISELSTVIFVWAIFILTWNTRCRIKSYEILFIATAYLFVGALDFSHIISYTFTDEGGVTSTNNSMQFWIAARYLEGFSLLVAPLFIGKRLNENHTLGVFFAIVALLNATIFYDLFPECFRENIGETAFKKVSESLIIIIYCFAFFLFYKKRKQLDPLLLFLLYALLLFSIISTSLLNINNHNVASLTGQCCKIIAILFLYKAVIESGVDKPFRLSFNQLKKRTQKLNTSEAQFRAMFYQHNTIMLQICPKTGDIIGANTAAEKFYGYTLEEFIQMNINQINSSPINKIKHSLNAVADGNRNYFVFSHRIATGETRTVEVHSTLIPSEEEEVLFSIIHDITEQHRTQQQLTDFIEQPIVINLISDFDGIIHRVNKGWNNVLGYNQQQLLGKRFIDFVHPDDHEKTFNEVARLVAGRAVLKFENRYRHINGEYRVLLWSATSSTAEHLIYATAIDITERQHAEKEQKHLAIQLQHAQKMEAIGTLTGGIAHDFNNILSSIMGYTEFVMDNEIDPNSPAKESLNHVLSASYRATNLTKRLLSFSRKSSYEYSPLSLHDIILEVVELLRATVPTNIRIQTQVLSSEDIIWGDPTQIFQVIMNLCNNALYAMKKSNGLLLLTLNTVIKNKENSAGSNIAPGKYIELIVSDNGCGIPPDILNKIFDPFFTTKNKAEGTGLGLSVSYGIVSDMNGYIHVESEEQKGTTFKVLFPENIDNEQFPPQTTEKNEQPQKVGNETILVVDDEELIGELYCKILQKQGYKVQFISNSIDALKKITENPNMFDVIITDQTMPNLLGTELVKKILTIRNDVPIILCTGNVRCVDQKELLDLGITTVLNKPVSKEDLLLSIRKVLDQ